MTGLRDRLTVDLPDRPDPASYPGRVIDERYRIERLLAEGGMGAVFVAEHVGLRKQVALKVILPDHAGNAELAERFAREAMISASLEHPHIVPALDYGALPEGGAYLVCQLARGRGLRSLMEEGPSWTRAIELGAQIADALALAHAKGVVHRDLKPENVIVDEDRSGAPHVWVLDFGIARTSDAARALTRVGTIMGTLGYMAPEQAVGQAVDARADVYALGVMLWELATGRRLYDQDELAKILEAQLLGAPEPLSAIVPDVPPELSALVARMLESSPANRPTDGAEVREALRRIGLAAAGRGVAPRRAPRPSAAATAATELAVPARTEVPVSPSGARRDRARARARAAALPGWGVAALAAGAALGLLGLVALPVSCIVSRSCAGTGGGAGSPTLVASLPPSSPTRVPGYGPAPAEVPTALATDVSLVVHSEDPAARAAAAWRLRDREGELPPYVRAVVAFEMGERCDERRRAIRTLRDLRDVRALPALERIAREPRWGCGHDGRMDCNKCLRRDLSRALEELGARPPDDGDEQED